jgi:simple sugar transport system ATP-binding protein
MENRELMTTETLLRLENINKTFEGGVRANRNANLVVKKGEIHAIVGENGAGKSTLMNILYGVQQPDEGKIYLNDKEVSISSAREAKRLGIGMVHQHFMLVPSFTVLQNVILGYEPRQNLVFVDNKRAEKKVKEICEHYNLTIPLHSLVQDVSVGIQQRVEIIKAIYRGAEILILDEPTAVLTPFETEELFNICREMVAKDKTIIFISHKLKEVLTLSNKVTVMRKGETLVTLDTKDTTEPELARLIVGRDQLWTVGKQKKGHDQSVVLETKNVSVKKTSTSFCVKNVSFDVKAGEIVGVAGVEGNGQSELMDALAGLVPIDQGDVFFNGSSILNKSTSELRALGIRLIPEDRMTTGASVKATIKENLMIDQNDCVPFISKPGVMNWKEIEKHTDELIKKFNIVAQGPETVVGTLSGGNLQKVVVARELSGKHTCLLVLQPARGLDIGASEFIYQQLLDAREANNAILLVSADLDELFLLSDRILVIYEGEIVANFIPDQVTPEEVGLYMTGAKRMTPRIGSSL